VQSEGIEVGQEGKTGKLGKVGYLVSMKIEHLKIGKLKYVISDLLNVVEGKIQPGNFLRRLHKVQGKLVQSACVDQAVVCQSDHIAVVPS